MVPNTIPRQKSVRVVSSPLYLRSKGRQQDFCFVSGNHISTLRGEMSVDDLKVGDLVRTKSGAYSPIVELTRHRVHSSRLAASPDLIPVVVRRHAVAEGLPKRDMMVTAGQVFDPTHRLKLNHLVRTAVRPTGFGGQCNTDDGFIYTVFRLRDGSSVRVDGIWTRETPAAIALLRTAARPVMAD